MDKTEWRMDPLTREWTIFSESRALPPAFGPVTDDALAGSPFLAGLERYAPHALHHEGGTQSWQVRVIPNRAPVLRVEGSNLHHHEGVYERLDGVGAHEIVIEDPGDCRFEELSVNDMAKVFTAWRVRIEDLTRDFRLRSFCVVKDTGRAAGQTIDHSTSQLFAMAVIPATLRHKLDSARAYFATKGHSLFADILATEKRAASRIIHENADFVLFCPYAAKAPFEMAIWPKRQSPDFHHSNHDELVQFAEIVRVALARLNKALDQPAWHFALTTAPSRPQHGSEWPSIEEDFRWHATITPRLHPTAGFAMATGSHVNGVWPEVAADFLRHQEVKE